MHRLALRAIPNLVAAAGAVGDDDGVWVGAHGRQQREFGHLHRHLKMAGLVAKAAGHAATARLDQLRLGAGNQLEHLHQGRNRCKGFLMAMAVDQNRLVHGL